jgi:hypothetical protein
VDWLAACIAPSVVGVVFVIFFWHRLQFAQSSSQWEQGPIREEITQILLTNKKK